MLDPAVVLPVVWAVLVYLHLMNQQRRHVEYRRSIRRLLCLEDLFQSDHPVTYCSLNTVVPILRLWFNVELEIKQDFREQDHGWGNEFEVLIYVYWLAHGLSYRVVSRVFSVPISTVHRIIHKPADLDTVADGFAQCSGTPVFNKAVDNDVAVDILDPEAYKKLLRHMKHQGMPQGADLLP
ncbi:unnamed protein product [Leuciscus chuanchicus]